MMSRHKPPRSLIEVVVVQWLVQEVDESQVMRSIPNPMPLF